MSRKTPYFYGVRNTLCDFRVTEGRFLAIKFILASQADFYYDLLIHNFLHTIKAQLDIASNWAVPCGGVATPQELFVQRHNPLRFSFSGVATSKFTKMSSSYLIVKPGFIGISS